MRDAWIVEALTDSPPTVWVGVALGWLRTLLLCGAAVAAGRALDAGFRGTPWLTPVLVAVALGLLAAVAGGAAEALPQRVQASQERLWRARVLDAVLAVRPQAAGEASGVPATSPAGRPDGELVDAATVGVEKAAAYRATFLGPTLGAFTAPLIVLITWGGAVHGSSALILAAFAVLVPIVIGAAARRLRASNGAYRRLESADAARYLELLEGLGTLRVHGAERRHRDAHAESARGTLRELGRLLTRNQTTIIVNDAVFGVGMTTVAVALVLILLGGGLITPGAAFTGLLLAVLLVEPIDKVGRQFYVGLAGGARRDQLTDLLGGSAPAADLPKPAAETAAVELRQVTVRLGETEALSEVSLAVPAGTILAIVGPSGAGKSTLGRVVQGLLEPTAGDVWVDGAPTSTAERLALVTSVGQRPGMLSATIADNLRLALPDAPEEALWQVLDAAHLADEVRAMPDGLATHVGEAGSRLSSGQIRRLAIARALLADPAVLVLDEPTADLDRRTEALVRDGLATLASGRTVIQIGHRRAALDGADAVCVLEGGRVVAVGTPDEVAAAGGFWVQARGAES